MAGRGSEPSGKELRVKVKKEAGFSSAALDGALTELGS